LASGSWQNIRPLKSRDRITIHTLTGCRGSASSIMVYGINQEKGPRRKLFEFVSWDCEQFTR